MVTLKVVATDGQGVGGIPVMSDVRHGQALLSVSTVLRTISGQITAMNSLFVQAQGSRGVLQFSQKYAKHCSAGNFTKPLS